MASYLDAKGHFLGYVDEPPGAWDGPALLLWFLERQRATFAWKSSGLDRAGLSATLGTSAMTLGGMLKHLARFEDDMSAEWLRGEAQLAPWDAVDWQADSAWDWHSAANESPETLYGRWVDAVERSRGAFAAAVAAQGEGRPAEMRSIAYILVNMIEEYARHNGHADLIRESIDGLVGHDPPTPVAT